jgi:hypothetical protein
VIFSNFTALDLSAMPSLTRKEARAHRVPLIDANQDSLLGFGRMVADFAHEPVTIVTWPQPDWRPIVAGTGNEGGIVEDCFVMERHGEIQHAVNQAVGRSYIISPCSLWPARRSLTTDRDACTPVLRSIS